jgi:phosphatidylinositol glycan class Q protein
MHPFSVLTLGIFVAGYITARWDLVTRLYELAIFAWENGVVVRFLAPLPPVRRSHVANTSSLRRLAQQKLSLHFQFSSSPFAPRPSY